MNVKLLRKVKKHILAEPKLFSMRFWLRRETPGTFLYDSSPYGNEPRMIKVPSCGTVGCIAGLTCLLAGERDVLTDDIPRRAKELLGLESCDVFWVSSWPDEFKNRYFDAKTNRGRASAAAAFMDHLIANKK